MSDESEPEPSLPPTFSVEIRGWHTDNDAEARTFAERLLATTYEYSRHLDLSRLSKVILAFDYEAALASVAGTAGPQNVATTNEFGQGAAMAVPIEEDGVPKNVVIVYTPLISSMFEAEDSAVRRAALQSYVHELAHVDDHAFLARTYPGGASAAIATNDLHGALLAMVTPARAEYDATRRTAFLEPSTGIEFLDMLETVLGTLFEEVRSERLKYNLRQVPLEEFWPWLQERCRFVFQSLGYALGHADGVLNSETTPSEVKADYHRRLAAIEATRFGWLLGATRAAVLPLYEQEAWTGLEPFDALIDVATRLLDQFGIELQEQDSGYWVDVPPFWDPTL